MLFSAGALVMSRELEDELEDDDDDEVVVVEVDEEELHGTDELVVSWPHVWPELHWVEPPHVPLLHCL
jgi:hypothetical protein